MVRQAGRQAGRNGMVLLERQDPGRLTHRWNVSRVSVLLSHKSLLG